MGRWNARHRAGSVRSGEGAGLVAPVRGVDFTAEYYNNEGTPQVRITGLTFPAGVDGYIVLHKRNLDPPPYTAEYLPVEGGDFNAQTVYNDEEAVQVAWRDSGNLPLSDYCAEFTVMLTD